MMKRTEQVSFAVNAKIYPIESILGTIFLFLDRVYIFLDGDPKKEIRVHAKLKKETKGFNIETLKGEFFNELVTQSLRLKLAKENKKIQEYIVGQALFSVSPESIDKEDELDKILERELKALEEEERTGEDDPMGVLTPWEEKNKKKTKQKTKKRAAQ